MNMPFSEINGSVAVSGLHRGDNPQPGAAVIAGLRQRFPGLRIIGLSYDPLESSLYSHGDDRVDAAYLMPYPRTGPVVLQERLDEILDRERIGFIIPCLDSEITNFIALETTLLRRGVRCMLPTLGAFEARNKANLPALCRRLDIPTPSTLASSDPAMLARFAATLGYPVYVKGKYYEAHLAETEAALYEHFNELVRVWGGPVLVQQVVVGEEYDVVGLGDGDGGLHGHCTIRKMLLTPTGKGFAGVVVNNPQLDELTRRIISGLKWNGPFELEFIKTPGSPYAWFEMNPRFPAWVHFPTQIGCNLPARLLECLAGIPDSPLRECAAGQMFIRHSIDLVGDIADLANMASLGERAGTAILKAKVTS